MHAIELRDILSVVKNLTASAKVARAHGLALDSQLCFALYAASMAMTKRYKPLLAPLGLTYPQYIVLLVLWEGDGITVSQLGERLQLDSGTLTPLLKRLEATGLIARLRDVADERRVHVTLTAAGRRLKAKAASIPTCVVSAAGCSLPDLASLTRQVQALRLKLVSQACRLAL